MDSKLQLYPRQLAVCLAVFYSFATTIGYSAPPEVRAPKQAEQSAEKSDRRVEPDARIKPDRKVVPEEKVRPEAQVVPESRRAIDAESSSAFGGARRGVEARTLEQQQRERANLDSVDATKAATRRQDLGRSSVHDSTIARGEQEGLDRSFGKESKGIDPRAREIKKSESRPPSDKSLAKDPYAPSEADKTLGNDAKGTSTRRTTRELDNADSVDRDSSNTAANNFRGREAIQRIETQSTEAKGKQGDFRSSRNEVAKAERPTAERVSLERAEDTDTTANGNSIAGTRKNALANDALGNEPNKTNAEAESKSKETIQRIEARNVEAERVEEQSREKTRFAGKEKAKSERQEAEEKLNRDKSETARIATEAKAKDAKIADVQNDGLNRVRTGQEAKDSGSNSREQEAIQRIENRQFEVDRIQADQEKASQNTRDDLADNISTSDANAVERSNLAEVQNRREQYKPQLVAKNDPRAERNSLGDSHQEKAADDRFAADPFHDDLTDPAGRSHILEGDEKGSGGHAAGANRSGKSEFPSTWSHARILHEISDIASDPAQTWTSPSRNGYITTSKSVDGINIKVVYDTVNHRIVTGYPTNVPRNP